MNTPTNVKVELRGRGRGLKRLKIVEASPVTLKNPKMKLKAAVAMRSLLNLLHIPDKRKESLIDETSAPATIPDSITSHVPSKLSSPQILNPTVNWLLDDKEYENLSKTWSHFACDPNEVRNPNEVNDLSDCENVENQIMCDLVDSSDGQFEPERCLDHSADINGNSTLVQRPPSCRIKMGISVLKGINTTQPCDPGRTCLELKHRSESSQRQRASLSATSTNHKFGFPAFNEHKLVIEGSRKATCSLPDSSPFPKASFREIEPGFCAELQGQRNMSFLPSKPPPNSKVIKNRRQHVDESNNSKNFMTASSSHILSASPKNVATVLNPYLQHTRDESNLIGQGYGFKSQKLCGQSSLLPLKITQNSNSTRSEPQCVNKSTTSFNLMKPKNELTLQIPRITTASNTNVQVSNDRPATRSPFLVRQLPNESLLDAVVPDTLNQCSTTYLNKHASCLAAEINSSPSIGESILALASFQTAATTNVCSQRRECLQSDYSPDSPLVACAPAQSTLPNPQIGIASTSFPIAATASHAPAAISTVRQLGSQGKPHILLSKSARRCLHGNLKHQLADGSLESNSTPKRAKTLECGIYKSSSVTAATSVDSKTVVEVERRKSSNLDSNVSIDTEQLGSNYGYHKPANYSLMNPVLKQRTLKNSKGLSNTSISITDVRSFHPSELTEVDLNGNFVSLLADRSILSPRSKQHLTPHSVIPAPLSTSSPMHHKKRLCANHEALPILHDFVSPVRHNPKLETCRATPKDSNSRIRRQRHRNNRHNRLTTNGNLDTSSDQEKGFVSPCSIDYVLLTRTAGIIVNRIPFKKEIKSFINMRCLLEYLQDFFLNEMSTLPSENIRTISEYRTLKAESCQMFTAERLTHENCLSELLVSVLVNEPNVVQTCSDFIFAHLRFLASCSDFYNMPPELFLMLLGNNKGIVLGYHGFPLPYEESVRQVQRAGRKYIQAHKTNIAEDDSKLENMLSFVIDQTAAMKFSHEDDSGENKFMHSYHEIKYRESEQFVTDTDISKYSFLTNLSLNASGSLQADRGESSDPVSYEKYCSNAYILRRIYFTYTIHDKVPYISQIRQQYAVQGRKVTYSIGNSTSKPGFLPSLRPANPDNWTDVHPVCTTEASDCSDKAAALPRSDALVTAIPAGKSPAADIGLATDPTDLKMSAVQLARGEHVTGIMLQGDSVLHNIMVITNKGRYIRAHGNVQFPGNTDWTLVPPPEESKYCLQAIVGKSRTSSSQTYLQSVSVVWSVLFCPNEQLNSFSAM